MHRAMWKETIIWADWWGTTPALGPSKPAMQRAQWQETITWGGLAGKNTGTITASYAAVTVTGDSSTLYAGGLVGENQGTIEASYARGSVKGNSNLGGLVGRNTVSGSIKASFAAVRVPSGTNTGGLVGYYSGTGAVTHSYWDTDISGQYSSAAGTGYGTSQLRSPTAYGSGIYAVWDLDLDGDDNDDDPWDFGTDAQYPVLKVDFDGDGTASWEEFGPQRTVPDTFVIDTYSAEEVQINLYWSGQPAWDGGSDILSYDLRYKLASTTNWTAVGEDTDLLGRWYTITGLTGDLLYDVEVRSRNTFGWADWGDTLTILTVKDYDDNDNGLIEVSNLAQLNAIRWDLDGNGSVADVDQASYDAAFPNFAISLCLNNTCTGYELNADLDFDTNGDSQVDSNDEYWDDGSGWLPIGSPSSKFNTTFDGTGHTIANLFINRTNTNYVGLFRATDSSAEIRNVGLISADVYGQDYVGSLVGDNLGTIEASYATAILTGRSYVGGLVGRNYSLNTTPQDILGTVRASYAAVTATSSSQFAGGLVGYNQGSIETSYATGSLEGNTDVGGLVGRNISVANIEGSGTIKVSFAAVTITESTTNQDAGGLVGENLGTITASYARGSVEGSNYVGGLVGRNSGTVKASFAAVRVPSGTNTGGLVGYHSGSGVAADNYWDKDFSGQLTSPAGTGYGTSQLRSPTAYGSGIYAGWDLDLDGDGDGDDPWDFGTDAQYPILSVDFDGDGTASTTEFGPQRTAPDTFVIDNVIREEVQLNLYWSGLPAWDGGSDILSYDLRYKLTSTTEDEWTEVQPAGTASNRRYTITGLTGGVQYDVQVRAHNAVGTADWGDTAAIWTLKDYDSDADGLIEISTLAQLDAIRWDLDGDGLVSAGDQTSYIAAFLNFATSLCLNNTCTGYELAEDLDFDSNGDGQVDSSDEYWNSGSGWLPIGSSSSGFNTTFDGSGHTIANLFINRSSTNYAGLFGYISSSAEIRNVGLVSADVYGQDYVGSLVGDNLGTIEASYATAILTGRSYVGGLVGRNYSQNTTPQDILGSIKASYAAVTATSSSQSGGGLVGYNQGAIAASYASGRLNGSSNLGGLVGRNIIVTNIDGSGSINASFAAVKVPNGTNTGGLVGYHSGSGVAADNYWDTDFSDQSASAAGTGYGTSQLRSPTAYGTGIYAGWNLDLDGDTVRDDPWDFGTDAQYPILKVDFDGDGEWSEDEFGPQRTVPDTFVISIDEDTIEEDRLHLSWPGQPAWDGGSDITRYDLRYKSATSTIWTVVGGDTNLLNRRYTIAGLAGGLEYHVQVRARNAVGTADWGETLTISTRKDYDLDEDGLIEVSNLAQLNAVRWDLDGDGTVATGDQGHDYYTAFPNLKTYLCRADTCEGYELAADLDFDSDGDGGVDADDHNGVYWNSGAGWAPIGSSSSRFDTTFDGNGHTIANLFISTNSDYMGLFGATGGSAEIRNVRLVSADVNGRYYVGSLVGDNLGTIDSSHASSTVVGDRYVGGLVGRNYSSVSITGAINSSHATSTVTGNTSSNYTGGLVGYNQGTINSSHATSTVTGNTNSQNTGGLVGYNYGTIESSHATSTVINTSGGSHTGGLAGYNEGTIESSYATGSLIGRSYLGGLAGRNTSSGTIKASYAAVTANSTSSSSYTGGLVGYNLGAIEASYARGSVEGSSYVGGLVGRNSGTVKASFAAVEVDGSSNTGGLVGYHSGSNVDTDNYWDTDISGQSTSAAGTGSQTSGLRTPTGYDGIYADWNLDLDGDDAGDDPWDFGTDAQYPVLKVDFDGDGTASSTEFGPQRTVPDPPVTDGVTADYEKLTAAWSAPTWDGGSYITRYDVRHILSSASAADDVDDDSWTESLDVWSAGDLEFEITGLTSGVSYDVQVRGINALGTGGWSASATGTPKNTNPSFNATFNATTTDPWSVPENSAAGTVVSSPLASSTPLASDPGNDDLTYGISGAGSENFTVYADGRIAVSSTANLDHEATSTYPSLTITVRDNKDDNGAADTVDDASISVTINVIDVNEAPCLHHRHRLRRT